MISLSRRQHRLILALACLAAVLFVSFALQSLRELGWHMAHAQGTADPLATASNATDAGFSLLQQYGPIWGGMLLVYGFASSLLSQAQSKHWIAQGRTLAMLVAGLGLFGSVLTTHFAGGQWQGVAITAVLAVFKLVNPVTIASSAPPKAAQAGFIGRRLMALIAVVGIGLGAVVACSSLSSDVKKDASKAIACAEAEKSAIEKGQSALAIGVQLAVGFGQALNSGTVEQWAFQEILQYGEPVIACFFKNTAATPPVAAGSGSATTARMGTGSPASIAAARVIAAHRWTFAP